MQKDFHYYGTYCAAYLAGYSHAECMEIAYSAQFVDCCTKTFLNDVGAPLSAATTHMQLELMDARTDTTGLHDITRVWSSFHFLPGDLYAEVKGGRKYRDKYRLICKPNGPLLKDTVELAKGGSMEAVGIAMHVLADTWAHMYFAGTPSMVINNVNYYFYEQYTSEDGTCERQISFSHNPGTQDDIDKGIYVASIYQAKENSIMSLGHGRAGHFPDYSFARYRYLPAWGDYEEAYKDNPADYMRAFTQMIYAMKYLRGEYDEFETDRYDTDEVGPYTERLEEIFNKRQPDDCEDLKALGESMSGMTIEDFDTAKYGDEYSYAPAGEKDGTCLGRFTYAAMAQKSMVTHKIYESGSRMAGISVDFSEKGFRGIRDFRELVEQRKRSRESKGDTDE